MLLVRFIIWIVVIYFVVRILGAVLKELRGIFPPSRPVSDGRVGEKRTSQDFKNVQDADFEDITDKK
jgi:hypothetical protein